MSIEISKFTAHTKNTLQGFFTIKLTNIGLEIRDCTLHQKDLERWIGLPAKPYAADGEQKWAYIVKFYEKDKWAQFQKAALVAIDKYLSEKEEAPKDSEIPFCKSDAFQIQL